MGIKLGYQVYQFLSALSFVLSDLVCSCSTLCLIPTRKPNMISRKNKGGRHFHLARDVYWSPCTLLFPTGNVIGTPFIPLPNIYFHPLIPWLLCLAAVRLCVTYLIRPAAHGFYQKYVPRQSVPPVSCSFKPYGQTSIAYINVQTLLELLTLSLRDLHRSNPWGAAPRRSFQFSTVSTYSISFLICAHPLPRSKIQ